MAIFDWTLQTISRSDNRSAVAAAAYRAGTYLRDERTGLGHDFSRRHGLRTEIVLPLGVTTPQRTAPTWHHELRSRLWNAAELAERRINSVTAREIIAALPHELDEPQREALGRSYARWLAERYRVAVDVAWHPPSASGDQRNHHLHMQFTTREVTNGFTLEAKTRILDAAATGGPEIAAMRAEWAAVVNTALMAAGREERIDHRSLADRGIDRKPGQHLGPMRTNMIRAKIKRIAMIDAEIAKLQAEIDVLEAEERQEREQARREPAPAVVIIDQRTLGPLGPYMAEAPVPALAWAYPPAETPAETVAPSPATHSRERPARPAVQAVPEPFLVAAEPVSPTAAASPSEPRPMPAAAALEAAVGAAALAEVERLNRAHAAAAEERASEEAEEAKAKKARRRPPPPTVSPAAKVKPPAEPKKAGRKKGNPYAGLILPPLRAPTPKVEDEDEDKPKKPKAKPLTPMASIGKTKGMARAIDRATAKGRSKGRGGRGR